ncbi:hypothetical protein RDWZM_000767 [Blomia tropicalis]|uniref:Mif2/CENP-C cupin domain-containing protein n=1 Tax=Blomia tropicalis TaxID=40697 RepID=A0A9Q0MD05_BLOTA|nr:hypothetical protein RDWZM_000767 [Blomia tropicalis]
MYHVRRRETVETIMVPHQPMNNQHHPPMHMNVNKFRNLFKKNHLMITSEVQKQNIINHLVHDNTFSSDAENTYNNSVILSSTPNGPKRSLQDFPSRVSSSRKRTFTPEPFFIDSAKKRKDKTFLEQPTDTIETETEHPSVIIERENPIFTIEKKHPNITIPYSANICMDSPYTSPATPNIIRNIDCQKSMYSFPRFTVDKSCLPVHPKVFSVLTQTISHNLDTSVKNVSTQMCTPDDMPDEVPTISESVKSIPRRSLHCDNFSEIRPATLMLTNEHSLDSKIRSNNSISSIGDNNAFILNTPVHEKSIKFTKDNVSVESNVPEIGKQAEVETSLQMEAVEPDVSKLIEQAELETSKQMEAAECDVSEFDKHNESKSSKVSSTSSISLRKSVQPFSVVDYSYYSKDNVSVESNVPEIGKQAQLETSLQMETVECDVSEFDNHDESISSKVSSASSISLRKSVQPFSVVDYSYYFKDNVSVESNVPEIGKQAQLETSKQMETVECDVSEFDNHDESISSKVSSASSISLRKSVQPFSIVDYSYYSKDNVSVESNVPEIGKQAQLETSKQMEAAECDVSEFDKHNESKSSKVPSTRSISLRKSVQPFSIVGYSYYSNDVSVESNVPEIKEQTKLVTSKLMDAVECDAPEIVEQTKSEVSMHMEAVKPDVSELVEQSESETSEHIDAVEPDVYELVEQTELKTSKHMEAVELDVSEFEAHDESMNSNVSSASSISFKKSVQPISIVNYSDYSDDSDEDIPMEEGHLDANMSEPNSISNDEDVSSESEDEQTNIIAKRKSLKRRILEQLSQQEEIIRPLDNTISRICRRSKRNRVRPLNFWSGQRPIYKQEQFFNGNFVQTIVGVTSAKEEPRRRIVRKANRNKNQLPPPPPPLTTTITELPNDQRMDNIMDLSIHINQFKNLEKQGDEPHPGIIKYEEIVWNESKNSPGILTSITNKLDGLAWGKVKFEPNAKKAQTKTGNYSTFFNVAYGTLLLKIDQMPDTVVKTGSSFEIKKQTQYSISNLRNDYAMVDFTIVKGNGTH